jgi:hypothetical protein
VDQTTSYSVGPAQTGGDSSSSASANNFIDLSAQAFGPDDWTYTVGATSGAITGPITALSTMPVAPAISLIDAQDSASLGTLIATLSAEDLSIP